MTKKYQQFIFEDYNFDPNLKTLVLKYSFDHQLFFQESYRFDFEFQTYNQAILDRLCRGLFFMAGVSYFKAYLPREIIVKKGSLDHQSAQFFSKTYERGLGEFFFVNNLDPRTSIIFPTNNQSIGAIDANDQISKGMLIGIGGGKDSLVSVELLRDRFNDLATWSVGHKQQLQPLIQKIELPHYWVEREWDHSLLELNSQDALNGHIPISAILAFAGSLVAVLTNRQDIVVSNEQSANEPTLHYQGYEINHQYSKSIEFEKDFQAYLKHTIGRSVRYYSILRPLSELRIADLFAQNGYNKYADVFSSCNQAFRHDSDHIFWDGRCPKCAFVFLALTPFVQKNTLESLFGGKNLLKDPALEQTYRQLLGIEGNKPLECIGEIKESRAAMSMATKIYPELANKYQFDLPVDYHYQALSGHLIPPEIYQQIKQFLID